MSINNNNKQYNCQAGDLRGVCLGCRAICINWQIKQAYWAIEAASGACSPGRNMLDIIVRSGFPLVGSPLSIRPTQLLLRSASGDSRT